MTEVRVAVIVTELTDGDDTGRVEGDGGDCVGGDDNGDDSGGDSDEGDYDRVDGVGDGVDGDEDRDDDDDDDDDGGGDGDGDWDERGDGDGGKGEEKLRLMCHKFPIRKANFKPRFRFFVLSNDFSSNLSRRWQTRGEEDEEEGKPGEKATKWSLRGG